MNGIQADMEDSLRRWEEEQWEEEQNELEDDE